MPFRLALLLVAVCLTLGGCGKEPDSPAAPVLPVAEVPKEQPTPVAEVPKPAAPKPIVPPVLPNDLAGRTVTKALMPSVPASPKPPVRETARPRVSPVDRGEPSLPAVGVKPLPSSPKPSGQPPRLSPPPDDAPQTLGDAAAVGVVAFPLPERPLLKGTSATNPGATDVPAMARQLPDRASVEDPTVSATARGIIETPLPLPTGELPYLKQAIPNPFEFAEQLKGELGKTTEFGTAPAQVNPGKR